MSQDVYTPLTVTNLIVSGAAFAIKHGTGESCYIPAGVMFSSGVKPGAVIEGILVENPNDEVRDRTPYMVRFIKPVDPIQLELELLAPAPAPTAPVFNREQVNEYVRATMLDGGVWTVLTLFRDYMDSNTVTREDDPQTYNAISTMMRKMHDNDECAKWSLWTKGSQSKPGREWFSCYPHSVDVAEFAD